MADTGDSDGGSVPRWPGLVATALAALVLLGGFLLATRPAGQATVAVVATRAVEAGEVLGRADLRLEPLDSDSAAGAVTDVGSLEGRVALVALEAGAPVNSALTVAPGLIRGRTPVALDAVWIADGVRAGQQVTVVLSPTEAERSGLVLETVPALGVSAGSGPRTATIAVTSRQLQRLASLVADAEVRISRAY